MNREQGRAGKRDYARNPRTPQQAKQRQAYADMQSEIECRMRLIVRAKQLLAHPHRCETERPEKPTGHGEMIVHEQRPWGIQKPHKSQHAEIVPSPETIYAGPVDERDDHGYRKRHKPVATMVLVRRKFPHWQQPHRKARNTQNRGTKLELEARTSIRIKAILPALRSSPRGLFLDQLDPAHHGESPGIGLPHSLYS